MKTPRSVLGFAFVAASGCGGTEPLALVGEVEGQRAQGLQFHNDDGEEALIELRDENDNEVWLHFTKLSTTQLTLHVSIARAGVESVAYTTDWVEFEVPPLGERWEVAREFSYFHPTSGEGYQGWVRPERPEARTESTSTVESDLSWCDAVLAVSELSDDTGGGCAGDSGVDDAASGCEGDTLAFHRSRSQRKLRYAVNRTLNLAAPLFFMGWVRRRRRYRGLRAKNISEV